MILSVALAQLAMELTSGWAGPEDAAGEDR